MIENDKKLSRRRSRENAFYLAYTSFYNQDYSEDEVIYYGSLIINDLESGKDLYAIELFKRFFKNKNDIINLLLNASNRDEKAIKLINMALCVIAITEIHLESKVPSAVILNEYIELAKKYSGEDDYKYIHGILGTIVDEIKKIKASN